MTENEVSEAKRLRRAARKVFDTQRELVQSDLAAASMGKRVVSRLVDDGRAIAEEATETAQRHKPIVAAGALALTGWFLRKPLMAFAASRLGPGTAQESDDDLAGEGEREAADATSAPVNSPAPEA